MPGINPGLSYECAALAQFLMEEGWKRGNPACLLVVKLLACVSLQVSFSLCVFVDILLDSCVCSNPRQRLSDPSHLSAVFL